MKRLVRMRVLCWLLLPATAGLVAAGLMQPWVGETQVVLGLPLSVVLVGLAATRAQPRTPVSGRRLAARAGGALFLACAWAVVASWLTQSQMLMVNEEMHLVLSLPVSVVLLVLMTPRAQARPHEGVADWIARACWALSLAWAWTGWASWFFGPTVGVEAESYEPLLATIVCGTLALGALLLAAAFGAYARTRRQSREAAAMPASDVVVV